MARRGRDEDDRGDDRALAPESVLRLAGDPASAREDADRALLALVDGKRTVGAILEESGLSGFVGMRRLRSLVERRVLIELDRPSSALRGERTMDLTSAVEALARARSAGAASAPGMTPRVAEELPAPAATTAEAPAPLSETTARLRPASDPAARAALAAAASAAAVPVAPVVKSSPVPYARTAIYGGLLQPTVPVGGLGGGRPEPTLPVGGLAAAVAAAVAENRTADAPTPAAPERRRGSAEPFVLAGYEVLLRIAQGGMGSIYLCRRVGDHGFHRLLSLKVVRQHAAQDDEAVRGLLREARVGTLVWHPNVVNVQDVGSVEGQAFLVLDYVEGTSLWDLLSAGPPPAPGVLVSILCDALAGLEAVHSACDDDGQPLGLIHCDITPQNIMVGVDGIARLTDFGSARLTRVVGEDSGRVVGKPAYLSPEMLMGEAVDARSDLFSAGVVLWTALTGQRLFGGDDYQQTAVSVLRKRVDPPSAFGAPQILDEICLKALARQREARYGRAEEMRAALVKAASVGMAVQRSEVGQWVRAAVGETLDERRRRVREFAPPQKRTRLVVMGGTAGEERARQGGVTPDVAVELAPASPSVPFDPARTVPPGAPATAPRDIVRELALEESEARRGRPWRTVVLVAMVVAMLGLAFALLRGEPDSAVDESPPEGAPSSPVGQGGVGL